MVERHLWLDHQDLEVGLSCRDGVGISKRNATPSLGPEPQKMFAGSSKIARRFDLLKTIFGSVLSRWHYPPFGIHELSYK